MIYSKTEVQHDGERERRKELGVGRHDQTEGIRISWREVTVGDKVRVYDRVEEVVIH